MPSNPRDQVKVGEFYRDAHGVARRKRNYRRASRYTEHIQIGFDRDLMRRITAVADTHQVSRAHVIRQAVICGLDAADYIGDGSRK